MGLGPVCVHHIMSKPLSLGLAPVIAQRMLGR